MTREEVIMALDINADCTADLMKEARQLLEQDREKELSAHTETVVKYKIVNREDLLSAFHEYIYAQADFYMNYTGRAESPETARTCMSEICGAAVLMNNILNPRKEESNAD